MLYNSHKKIVTPVDTSLPVRGIIDPIFPPHIEHWSHIRCGSYTSEWISKVIGIDEIPSNNLLFGPVWFDLFRPISPGDIRRLFKTKGMTTVEMRLDQFSHEEKLNWIRNEIVTFKRPPVILIRTPRLLHWIAIGGYDDNQRLFYFYDARIGKDSLETNLPIGNAVMTYEEILFWWSGRFSWNYVAIVVSKINKGIQKDAAPAELLHTDIPKENTPEIKTRSSSGLDFWS